MKKQKLSLKELKVKSFVTEVKNDKSYLLKGGVKITGNPCQAYTGATCAAYC